MTKRIIPALFLLGASLLFMSCGTPSPRKYFDVAVLNSNMLYGFANDGLLSQLESPSVKLSESTGQPVPMKRSELIEQNIHFIEEAYAKVQDLPVTEDAKQIVETSRALYELVIPVYKKEYMELAGLYDKGAPKEQLENSSRHIQEKYSVRFDDLYTKLISEGKLYAQRNGIKVQFVANKPG